MENQPSREIKALMEEELMKGRDMANQLLEDLVQKSNTHQQDLEVDEGLMLPFAQDLARQVLRSFTNTLLLLNNIDVSREIVMPVTIKDVSSSKIPKQENKDEACKSFVNAKRRRGCHNKRKLNGPTWEKKSSILIDDGYAWRKYGQKMTLNAKYLRSYYRCSLKNEKGCPAIKQVQRIQEDPPLYNTAYYGYHNCNSSLISEEIKMMEPTSSSGSSKFVSFRNTTFSSKEECPFSSTKKEPKEMIQDDHVLHNQLPSSDHLLLCDIDLDFDYLRHATMLPSTESVQVDNVFYFDG